jgi:hypothetical protein
MTARVRYPGGFPARPPCARRCDARGWPSPAQAFPSSIFRDKNRCDIGKSQPNWTAKDGNAWRTPPLARRSPAPPPGDQRILSAVSAGRCQPGLAARLTACAPPSRRRLRGGGRALGWCRRGGDAPPAEMIAPAPHWTDAAAAVWRAHPRVEPAWVPAGRCQERFVNEARWRPKPLAAAGKSQARRLNRGYASHHSAKSSSR